MRSFEEELERILNDKKAIEEIIRQLMSRFKIDLFEATGIMGDTTIRLFDKLRKGEFKDKDYSNMKGFIYRTATRIFFDLKREVIRKPKRELRQARKEKKDTKLRGKEEERLKKRSQLKEESFHKELKLIMPDELDREIFIDRIFRELSIGEILLKLMKRGVTSKQKSKPLTKGALRARISRLHKIYKMRKKH